MVEKTFCRFAFASKKGQIPVPYLMGLIVLLTVLGILFSNAQAAGDSQEVVKAVFAEEVRLALNALIAVPGDAVIQIPQNESYDISLFTVTLWDGFVEVGQEGQSEYLTARKVYHLPEGYSAAGTVVGAEAVYLVKDGNSFHLEAENSIPEIPLVQEVTEPMEADLQETEEVEEVIDEAESQVEETESTTIRGSSGDVQ